MGEQVHNFAIFMKNPVLTVDVDYRRFGRPSTFGGQLASEIRSNKNSVVKELQRCF